MFSVPHRKNHVVIPLRMECWKNCCFFQGAGGILSFPRYCELHSTSFLPLTLVARARTVISSSCSYGIMSNFPSCDFLSPQIFLEYPLCAELCYLSYRYGRGPHRFDPCLHGIFLVLKSLHTFKIWCQYLIGSLEFFQEQSRYKRHIE